jgi:hypothetical protein
VPPVGVLPLSIYNWPGALPDAPELPVAGGVPVLTNCWPGATVEAPCANATEDDAINKPPMAANGSRALIVWVSFFDFSMPATSCTGQGVRWGKNGTKS